MRVVSVRTPRPLMATVTVPSGPRIGVTVPPGPAIDLRVLTQDQAYAEYWGGEARMQGLTPDDVAEVISHLGI